MFSAALCRGLIEAGRLSRACAVEVGRFSAALCRGLIEATCAHPEPSRGAGSFPRLYAAASLKLEGVSPVARTVYRFPRLYAAASLKRRPIRAVVRARQPFSAALCRGLIEASMPWAP